MLRVVTLNTWKCDGDYDARLVAMTEALAALDADVLCLQECFAATTTGASDEAPVAAHRADTAATLAQALGLHCSPAPARRKPRDFRGARVLSTSGLAILTRSAPRHASVLPLPSDARDGERIAQCVTLRHGAARMRIVNVHLSHLRDAHALRAEQLEAVLGRWGQDETPVLIAGDFNCTFEDAPFAVLHARSDLDVGPEPAATWPGTLHARGHERAIDHVLLLRARGADSPRIVARARALDTPGSTGVHPSDHAAVCVEVAFP
ncbi:MAG: endonuclease/exonuclease/phosphatase family protein [Pseudomonadales bacterium]|jgi:endonuclease/exonuclease/phosphatase family metal-dependent hydrolase|nr:endonuclease/exonuclease/phosphatase family protein [Pseudomonadales bacterium]